MIMVRTIVSRLQLPWSGSHVRSLAGKRNAKLDAQVPNSLLSHNSLLSRDPVGELTAAGLDRYASQLARCLKALQTSAPIRGRVQHELATVRAGQHARASSGPGDPPRRYDASGLSAGELDRTRRELAASLALARPDSPARGPVLAHLAAIDAELAARPGGPPGSPAA